MCEQREKALDWGDPEGVHDMRVSSRRLRGALRDFMPYLRKRKLGSVLEHVKELADALGAVRDQDVAIAGLQKLGAGAPIGPAAIVDQLVVSREIVENKRVAIYKEHCRELDYEYFKETLSQRLKPQRRQNQENQKMPVRTRLFLTAK
jgi:CHAD domain-containing protein